MQPLLASCLSEFQADPWDYSGENAERGGHFSQEQGHWALMPALASGVRVPELRTCWGLLRLWYSQASRSAWRLPPHPGLPPRRALSPRFGKDDSPKRLMVPVRVIMAHHPQG